MKIRLLNVIIEITKIKKNDKLIKQLIKEGRIINAIKLYREGYGVDLITAKNRVMEIVENQNKKY